MADTRTAISEIITGLGLFGFRDLHRALAARPRFIVNVDDVVYDQLDEAFASGAYAALFDVAWRNGQKFARAEEGLRGRPPWTVEWKGPHRPPAYEQIPADLRVDHVYLISCKYGSKILQNASPWNLFDRALNERENAATTGLQKWLPSRTRRSTTRCVPTLPIDRCQLESTRSTPLTTLDFGALYPAGGRLSFASNGNWLRSRSLGPVRLVCSRGSRPRASARRLCGGCCVCRQRPISYSVPI